MTIEWTDECSVGVGVFDHEHQGILRQLNRILSQPIENVSEETISEIMTELISHISQHLYHEERYMREYGYPDYEAHHKAHLFYKQKIAELNVDSLVHNKQLAQKLLDFLSQWWKEHVLVVDMKYKDFFAAKGVK